MNKILVTGGAGFIGSKVAANLIEEGYEVHTIDNLSTGQENNLPNGIKFYKGDCSDEKLTNKLLKKNQFDSVLHIAGQSSGEISFEDPEKDLRDNVLSTLNLLKFAKENGCHKFIYASTMSVYGNVKNKIINEFDETKPLSMYAVGKLASENYLRIYNSLGIQTVSLRLFNVYGPGQNMQNLKQGMISIYLSQAINDNRIEVKGSPDRFRDFVYIDDVVDIFNFFNNQYKFDNYENLNVCTGIKTKVSHLLKTINSKIKSEVPISYIDGTPGDQFGIYGDNSKLLHLMKDFSFTTLDKGLDSFIKSLNI